MTVIPKRVGVVCDNYKLPKFLTAFRDAGFDDIETKPFPHQCTQIHINTTADKIETIRRICVKLEHTIKRGDN